MAIPTRWTADLETGIPTIDREHRELIEVIDGLKAAAASGDEAARVSDALDTIRGHTLQHFPNEEHEMKACNYPGLARHMESHGRLTDLVVALVVKQNNGETVLYSEVNQLANTLYQHILLDDKPFAVFLKPKA